VSGEKVKFRNVPWGEATVVVECECQERNRIKRMFKSSHITDDFQKLGFQNFITDGRPQCVTAAKEVALEYLKRFDDIKDDRCNSVALLGNPGCGKTHVLMAICNNLMRKRIHVMYFPWVEGLNDLKDNMDDLERKIRMMKEVSVLYIDDLFKGRKTPTEWSVEQLFGIVNYRYVEHLPILLSCEKDIDQLCDIDEGIGSRLYEMARNHTVLMKLTPQEEQDGTQLNYRIR
jgi:DNA replication protein DnaC